MTNQSNTQAAIERTLHDFENRERGLPQAHIAARLVAELRAALAAQPTPEPTFDGIAARKLEGLKAQCYVVDGYAIQHAESGQRGFITTGGFVGWWRNMDHVQPTPEPVAQAVTEDMAQAWADRNGINMRMKDLLLAIEDASTLAGTPAASSPVAHDGNVTIKSTSGSTWNVDPELAPALQAALDGRREPVVQADADDALRLSPNLHIGACIVAGKLHATVMHKVDGGPITVIATAEMDLDALRGNDCIGQMTPAAPSPVALQGRDADEVRRIDLPPAVVDQLAAPFNLHHWTPDFQDRLYRFSQAAMEETLARVGYAEIERWYPARASLPAGGVVEPSVPDGVWEALQRLIENGGSLGPASEADALLVARYRDRVRFMAPQPSETPRPVYDKSVVRRMATQMGWTPPKLGAETQGRRQMTDAVDEALRTGLAYVQTALEQHDEQYRDHPATSSARACIKADIEQIEAAIHGIPASHRDGGATA